MVENRVFVITGAAGSGKTTVRDYLHDNFNMTTIITHTTRKPRDNEVDGIDYYFETPQSFLQNHYLETVKYAGNLYGSSFEGLQRAWEKTPFATIVLDTAGAITYKQKLADKAVVIFLKVGDKHKLLNRMEKRGDKESIIAQRIHSKEYQRDLTLPKGLQGKAQVVINDQWGKTIEEIEAIINKYE